MSEWLTIFFVNEPTFNVIERRQLEAILQEQSLGQTGLLDEHSAAQVGQVLGVDLLVTGTIISVNAPLEVTARIVDVDTGAILGIASVRADDVDALRDEIETLGNALIETLGAEITPDDESASEMNAVGTFDSAHWEIGFNDDFPAADKARTHWNWEDGILSVEGTYADRNEDRAIWIVPLGDDTYTAIELNVRVKEFEGSICLCAEAGWARDTMWTGICPYAEEDYGDVTISLKHADETEAEEKFELNMADSAWHRLRLEYRDDHFQYSLDGRLLRAISPGTPIDEADDFWLGLSLYVGETNNLRIEFDEISGW